MTTDSEAMALALEEAVAALDHDDVPVGAVVIMDGRVIAARHNEREKTGDATAHAEILAIRDACAAIGSWRLEGAKLIATLEPCVMCAGALISARVEELLFATTDPKAGATGSLYEICSDPRLNHSVKVTSGEKAEESSALLKEFFRSKRR